MAGGGGGDGRRRRRRKMQLSRLYSFACGRRPSVADDDPGSRIGGPGFSRVVNAGALAQQPPPEQLLPTGSNSISTTKYNVATFLPKSLFEQFRRVANVYFLISACLAYTKLAPYTSASAIAPLVIVIVATMVKEAVEDWRRNQQDTEVNNRRTKVFQDGAFQDAKWKDLRVGDIVKVEKDDFFPADLVLLSSSYEDAVCYVETMNLDGETNLKLKQSLEVTSNLQDDESFSSFGAVIRCEDPNAHLYSFVGNIEIEEQPHPLSPQQLLLRDSKLRNTEFVYGVVIFTGHDTKVMQNAMKVPSKRSNIEKKMDWIIYLLLSLLVLISFIGSIFFGIATRDDLRDGRTKRWYLRPDDTTIYFDPKKAAISAVLHFLTAMMLYGYFIPISLYISIEIVKLLQARFINQDIHMYHEETDTPAHARTSNLNEELGQVDTILTDKTGTLTCNSMEFIKCSIAGTAYGRGITAVERAMAKRKGSPLIADMDNGIERFQPEGNIAVKGFNFMDERVMNGNWVNQPHSNVIEMFFRLLAVCHTCIPEVDEESGKISYEAESPDEAAFVVAARELGFTFYQRTQTGVSLHELDPLSGKQVDRSYKILHVLEFNSARKRMSVIVKDEEGKTFLFSKGADSVMFERLSSSEGAYRQVTQQHINEYADAGLRTLVLAYRELEEDEYAYFDRKFTAAKNSVSADRDEKIEEAADLLERDLILLGATAVEDKLQKGVPECIDKLAQAGIKIWVLTGDKMETAINIGYACSLLRQGMKQITITLETADIIALEKGSDKAAITEASKDNVVRQINEGKKLINASVGETFALIIDGKSLTYALEDDAKGIFLDLAIGCGSVICCRSSPKQKALVTRLVKTGTGKVTLAIGDGANDVGMIQEADIGVGISGAEGMQAVMASDVSIAQFRFLERLLLVHGHWCYSRISSMICYFFYKNITFGVTMFLYEAHTTFSGQAFYNDWAMALYNVLFTSLPVIAMGVFDQDVSARFCLKYPMLYQEGPQNLLFRWARILGWMLYGVASAVIIFFLSAGSLQYQAFRKSGEVMDIESLGATAYTCVVWAVNAQMAITVSYFTLIQHICIWGGIALWYVFLVAYGAITPTFSTTFFMVFVDALAGAPSYWVVTLLVSAAALIPYFTYAAIKTWFFPDYHNKIQWLRHRDRGQPDSNADLEFGQALRQFSVRSTGVGVSARRDAVELVRLNTKVYHADPPQLS
ncbi:putative phospholipid-transporting ATPase 9 [Phragmites australis]|uniref:putative phospholipid-transporting ATPase 9 n=1 Tax=Phragmites australis TaxID=29695 RepID=UPI002D76D938|nr:putative phospholipid-transporting ATPase 9 [Phragmites australis]